MRSELEGKKGQSSLYQASACCSGGFGFRRPSRDGPRANESRGQSAAAVAAFAVPALKSSSEIATSAGALSDAYLSQGGKRLTLGSES
jgi:hypothetical protein